jgi:GDP-4-dehydro-6-deoxy-D-mannose reductase
MKALITGINGFAGSYLAELLVGKNWEVAGTIQPGTSLTNIEHIEKSLSLSSVDLLDKNGLDQMLKSFSPDVIFHLAGASSVKESFQNPYKCFDVNIIGGLNLLESTKKHCSAATVLLVTSGEIYGRSLSPDKITDENAMVLPKSPYGVSKAALDMLGSVYSNHLKVIVARPFNHIGPRQSAAFFVPTVAKQIAMIVNGSTPSEISLGNLEVYRDFTDVRDVVDAYMKLALKGKSGEAYNICSGKSYCLKDIVEELIDISKEKIATKIDPAKVRKVDLVNMKVDNSKLVNQVDWKPQYDISTTLRDTLGYWIKQIA